MDFRRKYLLAIAVTTLLIVTNQIIIQYFLAQKRYDAKVINISGKQRMLSQRLMGLIHSYHIDKSEQVKKDIELGFEEWRAVHYGLIDGDKDLNLAKLSKDKILKLEEISPNIVYVEKLLKEIDNLNNGSLKEFKDKQDAFLIKMDKVVKSLETSSDKKLTIIIWIEIILALLTLIFLFVEVLWVLLPTVQQLTFQNKALQRNNEILEEYAFIASHDLRTPIVNIINFSNLLERKVAHKLDDKELKYLNFVKQGAKRMDETTKDLLAYGTSGQVTKKIVNIKELAESVIAKIQHEIQESNAIIKVGQLPENILADEKLIGLLFENLLLNAIKFVAKGKSPKVEISFSRKKYICVFKVKDNGIGIADANKQKIFGVFKRINSRKEYNGTGIGLALCKRIIEAHQGKIWVESTEQEGSTFYFTLPIN